MLNRSIICKVANQLHKSGYTLSQSFRLAWRLAKGKASAKVAGVTKGNRLLTILSSTALKGSALFLKENLPINTIVTQFQYMQG